MTDNQPRYTTKRLHDEIAKARAYGMETVPLYRQPAPTVVSAGGEFALGDRVRKTKGSSWQGRVVGFYSTELTPIGYAVESEREPGSVQIYPETALAKLEDQP